MRIPFAEIASLAMAVSLLTNQSWAQDPSISRSDPSLPDANQPDPSALIAEPAFGRSERTSAEGVKEEIPKKTLSAEADKETVDTNAQSDPSEAGIFFGWQPKLRIQLTTHNRESADGASDLFSDEHDSAETQGNEQIQQSAAETRDTQRGDVVLLCDAFTVNVDTPVNGNLVYTFACRGKFAMKIHGNVISGSNLRFDGDLLTMQNTVLRMNEHATMKAETLTLSMGIIGVKVESSTDAPVHIKSRLLPVPDPIGGGKETDGRRSLLDEGKSRAST